MSESESTKTLTKMDHAKALEIVNKWSGSIQPERVRFSRFFTNERQEIDGDVGRPKVVQARVEAFGRDKERCGARVEFRWLIKHDEIGASAGSDRICVDLGGAIDCTYILAKSVPPMTDDDCEVLARVSAIYHSWPYIREFCQNSLQRLAINSPSLPVLSLHVAIQMAGYLLPRPSAGASTNP